MAIPDFKTLVLPVLAVLNDDQERRLRELSDLVAARLHLSEDDRSQRLRSGEPVITSRTWYTLQHLIQAGLVDRPSRGRFAITTAGHAVLREPPPIVDLDFLRTFPSYRAFIDRGRSPAAGSASLASDTTSSLDLEAISPEEVIENTEHHHQRTVEAQLLDRVTRLDPNAFERLVLATLTAMGYGSAGAVEHSGRSGDGGVDGIISQDPLGLDRIYMQAKRYADNHSVGRPAIQEFAGALHGLQADRGVFMTTSYFTREALDYVKTIPSRIVLIDGASLTRLMLKYDVGVQTERTFLLKHVDEDFFDGL